MSVPVIGPTELSFDDAARRVARVLGKKRLFVRAPIASTTCWLAPEATMSVPLIAKAQVRILQEEVVEGTNAPDKVPEDLVPTVPFDEASIRRGLPARVERSGARTSAALPRGGAPDDPGT